MVLPGFVPTEGFPQAELRQKALTRLVLSTPEKVADAIYEVGPGGRPERYVPRPYALAAYLRILAPRLVRRVLGGGAGATFTPPRPNAETDAYALTDRVRILNAISSRRSSLTFASR
jgi:hypothetical protein